MKELPLSNSDDRIIVDDADYKYLSKFTWSLNRPNGYCQAYSRKHGGKVYLHRLLMDAEKGQEIDHLNRNKRDNRRCNLRFTTHSENMKNTEAFDNARYVSKIKNGWAAYGPRLNNRTVYLGYFRTEEEAIAARDEYLNTRKTA